MHDEILLEVPTDDAEEAKEVLENCMIEGMKKIIRDIPVIVETSISNNWCKYKEE